MRDFRIFPLAAILLDEVGLNVRQCTMDVACGRATTQRQPYEPVDRQSRVLTGQGERGGTTRSGNLSRPSCQKCSLTLSECRLA